ncbi:MAG: DNA-directed RNA polymerase subunit beta' [Armatimonadetes bacterium]|nr:DNA-directed RNA polymerase subunit beta' [Armatimonadota bacterium]
MADVSTFEAIRIRIASPEEIHKWSYGEVKKPETINYRTFKPERDGLFCERIFGPVKDWECHCGRYKKVKFKGIVCDRCGVEVTRSKVRRERMGHIELAAPVCHIWYLKGVPSPLSLMLDISPRPLEKVLYFASYVITHVDRRRINEEMDGIRLAAQAELDAIVRETAETIENLPREYAERLEEEMAALQEPNEEGMVPAEQMSPEEMEAEREKTRARLAKELEQAREREERTAREREQEVHDGLKLLETVEKRQLIPEEQYRTLEKLLEVLQQRVNKDTAEWVKAGLGAAAIKDLLREIDLDKLARELRAEIAGTQGPRRLRAIKRLEVLDAFLKSKARPEWMILDVVPVIPPELRPMVQLDGGRFATSDLNDLYRRIINRNNRLKKIVEIRAPESIVNHEKRLLQEAVDALIDNGRRTRPVVGSNNRPLRSLSDMLKGKEGRFRKNLLGKRVDYSGRSVIVVGPHLQLHQCGLPKEMALELFKPFVMKMLVETQVTSNIKTAKRMIDRMNPAVWDALERVIAEHPVLLNRAPTLHRLGIQAFEPVLVDGKAIQVHPLVCPAFNADFDGDQMAVHVPLSETAQAEARVLMLSTQNLFSPAHGGPIVAPQQDIVLGIYCLTEQRDDARGAGSIFSHPDEAFTAHQLGLLHTLAPIKCRVSVRAEDGVENRIIDTTAGRLYLNEVLPERMRYRDLFLKGPLVKNDVSTMVSLCYRECGVERTIQLLDDIKHLGFGAATQAGVTISMTDMDVPARRHEIIRHAEQQVERLNLAFRRGLLTAEERRQRVLDYWQEAAANVGDAIMESIDRFNPVYLITNSGARGSRRQITQLSGMRGLMSDPFGRLIEDLPIKSNFHEGLSVLEFFVSTHGARKGLADTALRTADAGYLTRRLVDVAQDVIVRDLDCGTRNGIYVSRIVEHHEEVECLADRIRGRYALENIVHPDTGEVLVEEGQEISDEAAVAIEAAGIQTVGIRSPLACELRQGICAKCYGRDMATGKLVEVGTAVGIIAAQSIGEPGTQLTMRTFHTGGVAAEYLTGVADVKKKKQETLRLIHSDIEQGIIEFEEHAERERVKAIQAVLKVLEEQVRGLLRVVELFEARKPKGQAIISEVDGVVKDIDTRGMRQVIIHTEEPAEKTERIAGEVAAEDIIDDTTGEVVVKAGDTINERLARRIRDLGFLSVKLRKSYLVPYRGYLEVQTRSWKEAANPHDLVGEVAADELIDENGNVLVRRNETITEEIARLIWAAGGGRPRDPQVTPPVEPLRAGRIRVPVHQKVRAGDRLTEGPLDPQKVLDLQGVRGVQEYLVREIQAVYKNQGVDINDKHIEIIVRQMLKKRKVIHPGDTDFLPGRVADKFEFEDENRRLMNTIVRLPDGTERAGQPATAEWMLLGITEASLQTDSFLSAASFQKTTRVLTEAAVRGKRDSLVGLKENVIIGRLIPAGTGLPRYRSLDVAVETEAGTYEVLKALPRPLSFQEVDVSGAQRAEAEATIRALTQPAPLTDTEEEALPEEILPATVGSRALTAEAEGFGDADADANADSEDEEDEEVPENAEEEGVDDLDPDALLGDDVAGSEDEEE